jgi:hypothetical protein
VRDEIHHVEAGDALALQEVDRVGVLFAEDGDQHVGAGDFLLAGGLHMQDGALDDALEAQGRLGVDFVAAGDGGRVLADEVGQFLAQVVDVGGAGPQHLGGRWVVEQRQQQVLDGDELVALLPCSTKAMCRLTSNSCAIISVSSITHCQRVLVLAGVFHNLIRPWWRPRPAERFRNADALIMHFEHDRVACSRLM